MEKISRMTLEEIAKQIGISRTTIYKVMGGKGNVSEETRRIVEDALEKYQYVQNRNARNLAMNRHYTIAYVGFKSKSANYFSGEVGKGLKRAAKEFGDDGLTMLISEFDVENPKEQRQMVEKMLEQGVRSFILAYSHREILCEILEMLERKKCRVVLLSRDYGGSENACYVGVDYFQSGRLAAELMGKFLGDGGSVFIPVTQEFRTNQDILSRLQGFQEKIREYPKVTLLPVVYDLMEEREIRERVAVCIGGGIQEHEGGREQVRGIFDLTYRLDVIADVLRNQGRKDIRLIGFDLFEEIREYLEDSTIDAVIYQDLSWQAYFAVKVLFEEMCYGRQRSERKRYSKLEVIMRENLHYFV